MYHVYFSHLIYGVLQEAALRFVRGEVRIHSMRLDLYMVSSIAGCLHQSAKASKKLIMEEMNAEDGDDKLISIDDLCPLSIG